MRPLIQRELSCRSRRFRVSLTTIFARGDWSDGGLVARAVRVGGVDCRVSIVECRLRSGDLSGDEMEGHLGSCASGTCRPRESDVLGGSVSALGGSYSSAMKLRECNRGAECRIRQSRGVSMLRRSEASVVYALPKDPSIGRLRASRTPHMAIFRRRKRNELRAAGRQAE